MRTHHLLLLPALAVLVAFHATSCRPQNASAAAAPEPQTLELGRHLVEDIGLCADCHTPRLANGDLDRTRWMQGAPIGFQPLAPMPWAPVAPPLGIIAAYTDEQAVKLFTQGIRHNGQPPLPPMPGYRFTEPEARAIIAYLRQLPPVPSPAATR